MTWSDAAIAQLGRWGITPEQADNAGLFETPDASRLYPDFRPVKAIAFPYYDATTRAPVPFDRGPFCRIRYLDMPPAAFGTKTGPKYMQPRASGQRVYFPPVLDWPRILADSEEPVIITEGEAKGLAGCLSGFPTIALGGVSSWAVAGTTELLPELDTIPWTKRAVFIVFDSDAAQNPQIRLMEARLIDTLQTKRGAACNLVRLPTGPDGSKMGLDDYLKAHGRAAFITLLEGSTALSTLDAKVIALNKSCAWIEKDALIWDMESAQFIRKDAFIQGSRFSALKQIVLGSGQRSGPKEVSVAKTWLTHPHAQRYDELVLRPGEPNVTKTDRGRPALNMWGGFQSRPGSAKPFLDLSAFLFQDLPGELRDYAIKLLAYKAQNPAKKIPIAVVMISKPGSGKGLWCELVCDAFTPYSESVGSSMLHSNFRGWLERTLLAVVTEAEKIDMDKSTDILKSLISDKKQPMNEKYKPQRNVDSLTTYILSANRHAVASFERGDRRMFVVECPDKERLSIDESKRDKFFTDYVAAWKDAGGGREVMHYLLNLPLDGWRPIEAPMTAAKDIAHQESLTPIQKFAHEVKRNEGLPAVVRWLGASEAWSHANQSSPRVGPAASTFLNALPEIAVRPFYTAEELCLQLPFMVYAASGTKISNGMSPGELSRQLRDTGIPYLIPLDNNEGFLWHGVRSQYLILCDLHEFEHRPLSQADFERIMSNAPKYQALVRGRAA